MLRIGLRPDDLTALRADAPGERFPPRPRLYGIGMGKTGTNVLASLFTGVPVAHEPESAQVIQAVLEYETGRRDWRGLRDFVLERDRRLGLAVDVSNLNVFLVDLLVRLDPHARFVLTIREPCSWLESIMNHYLRRPPTAAWRAFADHRFGKGRFDHPPEERSLADEGLYTLAGYLSYWRSHMEKTLESVPAERLYVVRTDRIAAEGERIAAFGGFTAADVDRTRIHEYRNPDKQPLLRVIPRGHLDRQLRTQCGPLLDRFFPESRSVPDEAPPA